MAVGLGLLSAFRSCQHSLFCSYLFIFKVSNGRWSPCFESLLSQLGSVSHSLMPDSATPRTAALQTSLSITNSRSLLKVTSIKSVRSYNHLIFCRPLLLLPSMFHRIRVSSSESALHTRWPNIGLSVSTSVLPMNIQD